MEKEKSLNHHKFFKYIKQKFISSFEKKSVDLCNICNGDLAKLIEEFRGSEEIIANIIEETDHFCTKSWELKCNHLYRMVFEELITTEPGLKKYLGCQPLARFACSNLVRNKDVAVFEDLKKCSNCRVCNKTETFENNEAEVLTLYEGFRNLFLKKFCFLNSFIELKFTNCNKKKIF
jgi:hypothetical protein